MTAVPSYLSGYETLYREDPHAAALAWFRDARYGLFIHYGLYSLLGRHEWVQLRERIPVAEYATLADHFQPNNFDAAAIAAFARDCGMRYVNLTTRHHDSFCLFASDATPFTSVDTAAGRDLVAELAVACEREGLGLFLYYSHGRDWKHPHAPNNDEWGGKARPEYDPPEPTYAYGAEHDLQQYLDFMTAQVTELLTNYGPVAGIWLDGISVPLSGDRSRFHCQELYDLVHRLQPQALVSYKQGLLMTEDFLTPEHRAVAANGKPQEINTTMAPGPSWGYSAAVAGQHKTAEEVWAKLAEAGERSCNLLLNTGPLPDGALDPEDEMTLRAVGDRLRAEGLPGA